MDTVIPWIPLLYKFSSISISSSLLYIPKFPTKKSCLRINSKAAKYILTNWYYNDFPAFEYFLLFIQVIFGAVRDSSFRYNLHVNNIYL